MNEEILEEMFLNGVIDAKEWKKRMVQILEKKDKKNVDKGSDK